MTSVFRLVLLLGILSGCSNAQLDEFGTETGAIAPPIQASAEDGHLVELSGLKGNYVIVEFYASWCGPCHRELPKLKRLYLEKQASKTPVEVISIALERDKKAGLKFLKQIDFPWPHQVVNESRFVRFDPIASAYDVTDIPSTFLIGPEGEILSARSSVVEIELILNSL